MTYDEFLTALNEEVETRFQITKKTLPYRTGNLAYNAFYKRPTGEASYELGIDLTIAPYAQYLNNGYPEYNIPGAFGRKLPFGTYGRFNGKFHPGSYKYKGFWNDTMVHFIQDLSSTLGGTITIGSSSSNGVKSIAKGYFTEGTEWIL